MSIHARIRERRLALKLSQQELAERIGVEYQTVQHWEREPGDGVKSAAPKRTRLQRVAEVLGVTPEWLMTGKDSDGNVVDPIKQQLVFFYDGMSAELQSALVAHANALYNASKGSGPPDPADPYRGKNVPKPS